MYKIQCYYECNYFPSGLLMRETNSQHSAAPRKGCGTMQSCQYITTSSYSYSIGLEWKQQRLRDAREAHVTGATRKVRVFKNVTVTVATLGIAVSGARPRIVVPCRCAFGRSQIISTFLRCARPKHARYTVAMLLPDLPGYAFNGTPKNNMAQL